MEQISELVKKYSNTVNSYKKDINTVNSKVETLLEELQGRPEEVATTIAAKLDDVASLPYYNILSKNISIPKLFEALSFTLDASSRGKIKSKKAVYFQAILRNWGIQTKFSR